MNVSDLTVLAIRASLDAGELLRHAFGTRFTIDSKPGIQNLVTECDRTAEARIISTIRAKFPHHAILAEESGSSQSPKSDVVWMIDPLDGTVNFAHSIPIFSISIGIAINGILESGVVYHPLLHELFVAERGKGAFLNGTQLRVSTVKDPLKALLVTGFPYNVNDNPDCCIDKFACMQHHGMPIRRMGSAALDLSYVAAGRFDAFWEMGLHAWDVAAGGLILQEAGGTITQQNGSPLDIFNPTSVLATNGSLHPFMTTQLTQHHSWRGSC